MTKTYKRIAGMTMAMMLMGAMGSVAFAAQQQKMGTDIEVAMADENTVMGSFIQDKVVTDASAKGTTDTDTVSKLKDTVTTAGDGYELAVEAQ